MKKIRIILVVLGLILDAWRVLGSAELRKQVMRSL